MRVAISTDGKYVSPHFGRCPIFTLIDIEDNKIVKRNVIENPGHLPGYIPQFLNEHGVKTIVCGGMGVRAQGFFEEYGIDIIMGVEGKIDDVAKELQEDRLKGGDSICIPGGGKGYGVEKTECDHEEE